VLRRISVLRIWGDSKRREQRAYYCQNCNCFHLTSQQDRRDWMVMDDLKNAERRRTAS